MSSKATSHKTLKDLFMAELADMYDAENRIVKALPKLAKAATSDDLKQAFMSHLKETEGQVTKLEKVFQLFGEKAKGKKCDATVGLAQSGINEEALGQDSDEDDEKMAGTAHGGSGRKVASRSSKH